MAAANDELATVNQDLSVVNEELRVSNDELMLEVEVRRQVEETLRLIQKDLNRAQAVARIGSWRLDIQKNELLWSDETYRMFGIAKGTPLNYEVFLSTIHPDDLAYVDTEWQAAMRGERPYYVEHRIVVGDTIKWVNESVELELNDQGKPMSALGAVQDITERKQIEQQQQNILEREHRVADTLQQALIPTQIPYNLEGWTVAARYQPALKEAQVGGDFYDVFKLGDGRVAVLIGDITGKGLAAAIRVAAVRHTLRSYAFLDPSPASVMALTNDALCREGADEQNVLTAFFAVMSLEDATITYANAGHEPPIVRRANGEIITLRTTGPMLGMLESVQYSERIVQLKPGDDVIMFTDGITEARHNNIMFETAGIIESLTRIGDAKPDEIAEALLQAATLHAGGSLQDDAAIVVLGYEGSGSA